MGNVNGGGNARGVGYLNRVVFVRFLHWWNAKTVILVTQQTTNKRTLLTICVYIDEEKSWAYYSAYINSQLPQPSFCMIKYWLWRVCTHTVDGFVLPGFCSLPLCKPSLVRLLYTCATTYTRSTAILSSKLFELLN